MDYYRDTITTKSWEALQALAKKYPFVLIGGWAVWLYAHRLKSKDIDIIIDFSTLAALKERYAITKNDRLTKYEAVDGPVSMDIYVPHWSKVGIPAEDLMAMAVSREGFRVAPPEALLVTKQVAYQSRAGSAKGRKDLVDIVSLLLLGEFNWQTYQMFIKRYDPHLSVSLSTLLSHQTSIEELNLNPHAYASHKRAWLVKLNG
ncbi:hypothetical protein HY411_00175 [Candidatus Gottesmanbacteria bacterium]|nr:hypothetical protein [Candidatus Gottesmanbacteria bacterium]